MTAMEQLLEILKPAFEDEDKARELFFQLRWPNGFVCPECNATDHRYDTPSRRYFCKSCKKPTSLTAKTLFHGARIGLRKLLKIVFDIVCGMPKSSLATAGELSISQSTAWEWLKRLQFIAGKFPVTVEEFNSVVLQAVLFRRSNESPAVTPDENEAPDPKKSDRPAAAEPDVDIEDLYHAATNFIRSIFHGISRKHAQLYADLFNYVTGSRRDFVEFVNACVNSKPITRAQIVGTFSPPILRLVPLRSPVTADKFT